MGIQRVQFHILFFLFGILITIIPANDLFSQEKFEQEKRIRSEAVPVLAIAFIDSCQFNRKIRWYLESSDQGLSFEAKTKFEGRKFSIEFDTLGHIQDVEWKTDFDEIPRQCKSILETFLQNEYRKYKIVKVQCQWTGKPDDLIELIKTNATSSAFERKFEIVVEGKKGRKYQLYEYLFTEEGKLIHTKRIIPQNTDHLDY